ncbi:unnamed protein product, partial [Vitis vinifera]
MPHTLSTRRLLPFAMMLISRRRLCDSSLMRNTLGASLLPSHSMPRFQGASPLFSLQKKAKTVACRQ